MLLRSFALAVLLGFTTAVRPAASQETAGVLHCRIELDPDAKSRRCTVTVPPGRTIRACTDADRRAGRCDREGRGRYVAWVVGTGPGRCRITDKRTKWKRGIVSAKLSRSVGAPSTCQLYVAVQ